MDDCRPRHIVFPPFIRGLTLAPSQNCCVKAQLVGPGVGKLARETEDQRRPTVANSQDTAILAVTSVLHNDTTARSDAQAAPQPPWRRPSLWIGASQTARAWSCPALRPPPAQHHWQMSGAAAQPRLGPLKPNSACVTEFSTVGVAVNSAGTLSWQDVCLRFGIWFYVEVKNMLEHEYG